MDKDAQGSSIGGKLVQVGLQEDVISINNKLKAGGKLYLIESRTRWVYLLRPDTPGWELKTTLRYSMCHFIINERKSIDCNYSPNYTYCRRYPREAMHKNAVSPVH